MTTTKPKRPKAPPLIKLVPRPGKLVNAATLQAAEAFINWALVLAAQPPSGERVTSEEKAFLAEASAKLEHARELRTRLEAKYDLPPSGKDKP